MTTRFVKFLVICTNWWTLYWNATSVTQCYFQESNLWWLTGNISNGRKTDAILRENASSWGECSLWISPLFRILSTLSVKDCFFLSVKMLDVKHCIQLYHHCILFPPPVQHAHFLVLDNSPFPTHRATLQSPGYQPQFGILQTSILTLSSVSVWIVFILTCIFLVKYLPKSVRLELGHLYIWCHNALHCG